MKRQGCFITHGHVFLRDDDEDIILRSEGLVVFAHGSYLRQLLRQQVERIRIEIDVEEGLPGEQAKNGQR